MPIRMTNQREIILKELQKSRQHMTADELYWVVREKMPRISLATVYRNLEFLSEAGIIAKLEVGGRQKCFDSDVLGHDHVICVQCHRVDNVILNREKEDYPSHGVMDGYIIIGRRLEFVGLCPKCQKKNRAKEGDKTMGCGCGCAKKDLSDEQKKILQAMAECDGPCAAKDIAITTGLDAKIVSSKITDLKKKGYVDSPVRCKSGITAEGRAAIKD
ncbi:MAG: transcriptional repressor [Proteobacteria bacterium]|nr:transcriptional repressor [Desulfocapsa sp.]MBU3946283.1 transcriptional repressor [Pseudomonadota bacterium]MCG2742509.1 transcriptional repressor [Desulfobacteraceae bacterium]MBU3981950.1 transcriptional repressor [Pseudomonadota bacterium]MBU4028170.1 transcriptional repressor [Pseudomonadota bacterium]